MRIRTKNREKLKVFEFWAFQKIEHMPSREKYIFHMLFRAFHNTPRIRIIHSRLVLTSFVLGFTSVSPQGPFEAAVFDLISLTKTVKVVISPGQY